MRVVAGSIDSVKSFWPALLEAITSGDESKLVSGSTFSEILEAVAAKDKITLVFEQGSGRQVQYVCQTLNWSPEIHQHPVYGEVVGVALESAVLSAVLWPSSEEPPPVEEREYLHLAWVGKNGGGAIYACDVGSV